MPETAPTSTIEADPREALRNAFNNYTKARDMDNRTFVKCLKESGVIDRNFTQTSADLLFAKAKAKGAFKICFEEFEEALLSIAERKDVDPDALVAAVGNQGGPTYTGTAVFASRFHDDKAAYTGVHARGGPDVGAAATGTFGQPYFKEDGRLPTIGRGSPRHVGGRRVDPGQK